ncbi:hypothetical protein ACP275_11G027400 [Erythranthe tilingii]
MGAPFCLHDNRTPLISILLPDSSGDCNESKNRDYFLEEQGIKKSEYWQIQMYAPHKASSPSSEKRKAKKEVVMVDPVEAKRLAAKQMELIKAKEKFIKRRQIEAINGAWAMIGLTAGLVIEGQTGDSILAQLAGYGAAFLGFFVR